MVNLLNHIKQCPDRKYVANVHVIDHLIVCLRMQLANTHIELYLCIWLCQYNSNTVNKPRAIHSPHTESVLWLFLKMRYGRRK